MRLILTNLYQVLLSFIYAYFENKNVYGLKILARKSHRNFTDFKKMILQNSADRCDRVHSFCRFTFSLITENISKVGFYQFTRFGSEFPKECKRHVANT